MLLCLNLFDIPSSYIRNAMTSQEVIDFVKERLDEGGKDNLSGICEEVSP